MTAASNSDARKREAERAERALGSQKSALGATNIPESGSGASEETSAILSAEQRGAIRVEINREPSDARSASEWAAVAGSRRAAALLLLDELERVREHRAEVLAEIERRLAERQDVGNRTGDYNGGLAGAIAIVRDYRQEQNR